MSPQVCEFCGKEEEEIYSFFKCHYCGKVFCSEHRIPEKHDCEYLNLLEVRPPRNMPSYTVSSRGLEAIPQYEERKTSHYLRNFLILALIVIIIGYVVITGNYFPQLTNRFFKVKDYIFQVIKNDGE